MSKPFAIKFKSLIKLGYILPLAVPQSFFIRLNIKPQPFMLVKDIDGNGLDMRDYNGLEYSLKVKT